MPAAIGKINPENSDFTVGNFLTINIKATSFLEVAFIFISFSGFYRIIYLL